MFYFWSPSLFHLLTGWFSICPLYWVISLTPSERKVPMSGPGFRCVNAILLTKQGRAVSLAVATQMVNTRRGSCSPGYHVARLLSDPCCTDCGRQEGKHHSSNSYMKSWWQHWAGRLPFNWTYSVLQWTTGPPTSITSFTSENLKIFGENIMPGLILINLLDGFC